MVNYSNKFATGLYGDNLIDSGKSVMFAYIGIAVGDLLIGWVSQYFESRKKALFLFYMLSIVGMVLFFSAFNNSDSRMYAICAFLGFSTGYWAIFNQMAAEQFGTNLRATAATPKNILKMTICKISLVAMASNILFGNTCSTKLITLKDWVLPIKSFTPEVSPTVKSNPSPGFNRFTKTNPINKLIKEADKNHNKALPPTRPTVLRSPNFAIPTTNVVNTNGAMII